MTSTVLEERRTDAPRLSSSGEFVAAAGAATVAMGERLGLYEIMGDFEGVSCGELALASKAPPWFIQGWLEAQFKAGFVVRDPDSELYALSCRI